MTAIALAVASVAGLWGASARAQFVCSNANNGTGQGASATYSTDVACGPNAVAAGTDTTGQTPSQNGGATAIGSAAQARDSYTTATGATAIAAGDYATATGAAAQARDSYATATGATSTAAGNYATAIGAAAAAQGDYTTAIGAAAAARGSGSTAIGYGALALGSNSVALGVGSSDGGVANVLSLGPSATNGLSIINADNITQYGNLSTGGTGTFGGLVTANAGISITSNLINGISINSNNGNGISITSNNGNGISVSNSNGLGILVTDPSNQTGIEANATYTGTAIQGNTLGGVGVSANATGTGGVGLVASSASGVGLEVTHGGAQITGGLNMENSGITGVTPGTLSATSTDAVNGSQLYATNQSIQNTVQYDDGAHAGVTLGGVGAASAVALTNIAAGQIAATSTDAVNGSQLFATNQAVTANTNAISDLSGALSGGTVGLVQQTGGAPGSGAITVGAATGGTVVDLTGTSGTRTLTGVSAGALSATSTDAVNGSQLYATNQALASTSTLAENAVQYDDITHTAITLGGAGASSPVALTNVAPGALSSTSTDAVNGSQLYATNQAVAANTAAIENIELGNGVPYFHVDSTLADGQASGTDAMAVGPLAVASGDSSIAMGNGASASGAQSISIGTGNVVSGTGSGALGDPNTVTGDGSYAIGDNNTVAASNAFALGNGISIAAGLDGAVVLGNGSTASTPVAVAGTTINGVDYSFAGASPVAVVSVGSAGAERQIKNVAAGQISATSTDAVNGSQLYATNAALSSLDTTVNNLGTTVSQALGGGSTYTATGSGLDGSGGGDGTGDGSSASGTVSAPAYVVNGQTYTNVGDALAAVEAAATTHYFGVNDGGTQGGNYSGDGATGTNSVAVGVNTVSSGANSTAVGNGASTSGDSSTALGNGAVASAANSVALGANSVASGANTVSVGAPGAERTISNVAPGVNGTDAVNVNQLNSSAANTLSSAERYADRGVASALAMPSVPMLNPGDRWVGAAVGGYGSAQALGVAMAYQPTANLNLAAGVSTAVSGGGTLAFRVQAGYRW